MIGDKYIELLRSMVATESLTYREDAVRQMICDFLTGEGIKHGCIRNNILALNRHHDARKPTLMLCAHIDTVPPCSGYGFDPFKPDYDKAAQVLGLDKPFVAGLGSNDDGGSVVSMIATFCSFYNRTDLPFNLLLGLTCQEENSGPDGSRYLWSEYWQQDNTQWPKPDYAIIGEPTSCNVASSERGLLVIDAVASGVSGHAARNEGVNALYIAMDDIQTLRNFVFDKVSPLMGRVKLTVTQINAGTAHNVVPDKCSFVVDIRPTECYTNPEILEMLQAVCKSTLKARNLTNMSSAANPDGPLMKAVEQLGYETFSSPTTSDWMRTRCQAIKMGPGNSSRSHHSNEYILVEELDLAVSRYTQLLETIKL